MASVCTPAVVPPQSVSDHSIIDTFTGFINDTKLISHPPGDGADVILWARFETVADISDVSFGESLEGGGECFKPLLIILGYAEGIQVWAIPASGQAVEVLSWRKGTVRALRILPTPIISHSMMAEEPADLFTSKRPLMAMSDNSITGRFCSIRFLSLRDGDQVKIIKFQNQIRDIYANRTSIAVTFDEKIAVFDSRNLEDRLTITTCHPSPGMTSNPIALGSRWLAYAESKLLETQRTTGGCNCDGVLSYAATVFNAAKIIRKGLRDLGEHVTTGLKGSVAHLSNSTNSDLNSSVAQHVHPGVVTILDISYSVNSRSSAVSVPPNLASKEKGIIAHFPAHKDALAALSFDSSGLILLTADKTGHNFHVYKIHPHPGGSALASVHHLYVLHRGDTCAKVQDISFSMDSRWVAVSTHRGTTHIFPINPYGGPAGVRTHASLHVVNRLSRFHKSAGLCAGGQSDNPARQSSNTINRSSMACNSLRMPSFPKPTIALPIAQLRQPLGLGIPFGNAQSSSSQITYDNTKVHSQSDDFCKTLRVSAIFAHSRSWQLDFPNTNREFPPHKIQRKVIDPLFTLNSHGSLIQYDLDAKHASNIPKEKVSDDTDIELKVEAKAQWSLARTPLSSVIEPPLDNENLLLKNCVFQTTYNDDKSNQNRWIDGWLSQVEIISHAGPHRRLWMGPQFIFKTIKTSCVSSLDPIETESTEIPDFISSKRFIRSKAMNLPFRHIANRSSIPVLIESASSSSFEHTEIYINHFCEPLDSDFVFDHEDSQLKEVLADAMRESPAVKLKDKG